MVEFSLVDLGIASLFLVYVAAGAAVGTLAAGVLLLTLLGSVLAVLYAADYAADLVLVTLPLELSDDVAFKVAALVLVLLTQLGGRQLVNLIRATPGGSMFGSILGGVIGYVRALLFSVVVCVLVGIYIDPQEVGKKWEESLLLPYLGTTTKRVISLLPATDGAFVTEVKELYFKMPHYQPITLAAVRAENDRGKQEDEAEKEVPEPLEKIFQLTTE